MRTVQPENVEPTPNVPATPPSVPAKPTTTVRQTTSTAGQRVLQQWASNILLTIHGGSKIFIRALHVKGLFVANSATCGTRLQSGQVYVIESFCFCTLANSEVSQGISLSPFL